ncbi:ATP-dependent helicase, partial [Paenibacillus sepulcri]|nr:ATP-dependent helicase [Paenibacillus sepulcri]
MSIYMDTITIQISLSAYGDAVIYGSSGNHDFISGLSLKQRLFAWHEASFYGTELSVQTVQGIELVLLPSEFVIPFFAERELLAHIEWVWEGDAAQLIELAPMLAACIEEKKY